MGTKVITNTVGGTHLHLFLARAMKEGETPKFSMTALISKSDTKTLTALQSAMEVEIKKRWGANATKLKIHSPLHDGDGQKPSSGEPYGPECQGCYVLSVSSTEAPGVVDANVHPITDPAEVTFRDSFRLSLDAFTYEQSGRRGVSFALVNVQQVEKALPRTKRTAAEDFGVVEASIENEEEDFLQ